MQIIVDGRPQEVPEGRTLLEVLSNLAIELSGLTVLVNGRPLPVGKLGSFVPSEADKVEVKTASAPLAKRAENVLEAIGNTPLVRLRRLPTPKGAQVWCKLEATNPAGSVKDRIGLAMIEAAEQAGLAIPGETVIVEATSGNTGIGLAMVAAAKGYRLIVTMPETMTPERVALLELYGAEVVLTPGSEGMKGAVRRAEEIVAQTPGAFMPQQFTNPANPEIHYRTTGPEIYQALGGEVTALVAGVGTGGTITGTGRYLRERIDDVLIVAVEPAGSSVLSGNPPGPHGIQGIGAGFIPEVLDRGLLDEVIAVDDEDAIAMAKRLAREEGISAGISAGAAVWAALQVAERFEPDANVAVTLPDDAIKYLSVFLSENQR